MHREPSLLFPFVVLFAVEDALPDGLWGSPYISTHT